MTFALAQVNRTFAQGGSLSVLQEEGRVSLGSQPEPPESNDLSNLAPPDMTDTIDGKSSLRKVSAVFH